VKPGEGVRAVAAAIVRSVTSADDDESQQLHAAERILAGLQDELVRLVGTTGFHALLDRSFHRAAAEQGFAVRTRPPAPPGDYMRSFNDNMSSVPPSDVHGALVAVLAELLSLLTRLIGADITAGVVQRTWPDAARGLTAAHLENTDG
jgi:hypothetical protein